MNPMLTMVSKLRPGCTVSAYIDAEPGRDADVVTAGHQGTSPRTLSGRYFLIPTLGRATGYPYAIVDRQPHCDSGEIVEREP